MLLFYVWKEIFFCCPTPVQFESRYSSSLSSVSYFGSLQLQGRGEGDLTHKHTRAHRTSGHIWLPVDHFRTPCRPMGGFSRSSGDSISRPPMLKNNNNSTGCPGDEAQRLPKGDHVHVSNIFFIFLLYLQFQVLKKIYTA